MKHREYLYSSYADLLSTECDSDPVLLSLVHDLDAFATKNPPAILASSIESALRARQRQNARKHLNRIVAADQRAANSEWLPAIRERRHFWPSGARVGLVAFLATVLFSLGITVYAIAFLTGHQGNAHMDVFSVPRHLSPTPVPSPIASPTYDGDIPKAVVGLEHLEAAGMGKEVNLSETKDGYTVNLGWVYADGNQVLIRYSISPSSTESGLKVDIGWPITLSDDQGRVYPTIEGGEQTSNLRGPSAIFALFDTRGLDVVPSMLNLHLTVNLEGSTDLSQIRKTITPGATPPKFERKALAGPFEFVFSVPFIPARVERIAQSLEVEGQSVTLDEFRISPAEARAIIHFNPQSRYANLDWRPTLHLSAGAWTEELDLQGNIRAGGITPMGGPLGDGQWYYSWNSIPYNTQETWNISVTRLIGYDTELKPQIYLDGPWNFKVDLPPAK